MTIKELIEKYKNERLYGDSDDERVSIEILHEISDALIRGIPAYPRGNEIVQWQLELGKVTDNLGAMQTFFAMFMRGISRRSAAFLSYYFATKVILTKRNPNYLKEYAYFIKSIVIFKYYKKYLEWSQWVIQESYYKGHLNRTQFFDIFLLANVYMAWNYDADSDIFEEIKKQAPIVASNHPTFSKEEIIKEGLLASDAFYEFIANVLKDPSFPINI
jgi:hypothetical protein